MNERTDPNGPRPTANVRSSTDDLKYALRNDVAIEDFGARALALRCDALELREINAPARRMLALLDGVRTVKDIAAATGLAREVVRPALAEMERLGIVRRAVRLEMERIGNMSEVNYLADPDASFRPEDDGGGILYSAERDSLEVLNPVAAEIWKFLSAPRTRAEVAAHLCETCAGAERGQVANDVAEFLESLLKKGFIGVVEDPA